MHGSLPAFSNSDGVTYEIRYRIAGSSVVHVHQTGIPASAPFNFALPQPGNLYYTHIEFYFGTVPADFALGNQITLTFRVGDNAPNNTLINHFVVMHNGAQTTGDSSHDPTVIPPTLPPPYINGNHTLVPNDNGNGYFELDDNGVPLGQWMWNDQFDQWEFIEILDPLTPLGAIELGAIPQTGIMDHALWLASALFLAISAGLGTMSFMKAKKRKH